LDVSGGGKAALVGDAVSAAAREVAELQQPPEQTSLFQVPTRFTGARGEALQRALVVRHGAGRPSGATNKATAEFRQYLLKMGVSPLVQLMKYSLHTPVSLAAELGCSKTEALRLLKDMWAELAPYLHSRVAPTDDQGQAVPFFSMSIGGAVEGLDNRPPWERYMDLAPSQETQQNQALPQPDHGASHGEPSHEDDK
jgi:hypothetical protein